MLDEMHPRNTSGNQVVFGFNLSINIVSSVSQCNVLGPTEPVKRRLLFRTMSCSVLNIRNNRH